jgi:hypothetical protein
MRLPRAFLARIGKRRLVTIDGRTLDHQCAALIEIDERRGALDVSRFEVPVARRKLAAGMALLDLAPAPDVAVRPLQVVGAVGRRNALC